MRRQLPRRRRAELAWCLAGFVAVQLALAAGVERLWPAVRDPEFGTRERLLRDRLAEAAGRPLVLALGSSRTLMGLDARRLSEAPADGGGRAPLVFTFGVGGSGPLMQAVG